MMSVSPSNLVVVESNRTRGMQCVAFKDRLDAVLKMINQGDIGGGTYHGCSEHLAALDSIEKHITEVRKSIEEYERDQDARDRVDIPGLDN